ncbi:MAG: oligoendopeptidase F [Solobacterium sp.]|jgi:oligoendopeptidase F|nr:oligoendopeptidase F [Solobacterium sp.]MCH4204983.1 oligoendopeptidase F [Solobacterium sp.]MCH4226375.1 oligoendopeptidase F [Solobacterium sp.]MCH4281776.1 oligoendopeptidase F [Solobacterium sp.]
MTELKERSEMDPAYEWNLSSLYKNDEAFEEALKGMDALTAKVSAYQGKLKDAHTIHSYLQADTALSLAISNVMTYASLRRSEDTRDSAAQSMYGRANAVYAQVSAAAAFGEPEILSLPEEELAKIIDDDELKDYRFYLQDLLRSKAHTLSAKEESLLAQFSEVLANPGEVSDTLHDADMVFEPVKDSEGKEHEVSGSSYILLQTSSDRVLRENAFHSYYKGYRQHINTFAATYSGCVKGAVAEAKVRHYGSSREMSLAADNIPTSVYDNLIAAVHARMDLMYRYVRLRKRILKLDELHYYDVYAPLVQAPAKKYTYAEAQEMVLKAVAPLGTEYVERVKKAYAENWIDVYPNKGKSGGAYSSGTYTSNPFILTNFTGTLDSVSTIAHEMGHSQHSWLTNHAQPSQYSDYSLFVAEVASTVNENLLIEQMLQEEKDPQNRLALLNQYLEGFKGTVYRQTMFAEFEKEAHAMAERGESLNPKALNSLYEKLIKLYFGKDLTWDDEVQYEWARIPHFYYVFYVYVYATGYSSAAALSEGILQDGAPAVKKYLEFLSMGSSAYPLDELKHAGVDLTTPAPIETALDKFEKVLEEAEKTADLLHL